MDGFRGEVRPGEPPGEERPHRFHRQPHAVRVRRLPGECVTCAGAPRRRFHPLFLLFNFPVPEKRTESPQGPFFISLSLHFSDQRVKVSREVTNSRMIWGKGAVY